MKPKFPVIQFGETCGVLHYGSEEELSKTLVLPIGLLSMEGEDIIDVMGQRWKPSLGSKVHVPVFTRIKAWLGRTEYIRVDYEYQTSGSCSVEQIRNQLIEFSANDPGDLMWQFIGHEEIVAGVSAAKSYEDLFNFIEQKICGADEA